MSKLGFTDLKSRLKGYVTKIYTMHWVLGDMEKVNAKCWLFTVSSEARSRGHQITTEADDSKQADKPVLQKHVIKLCNWLLQQWSVVVHIDSESS